MPTSPVSLTIGEQIDRAKDGRSQKWIVRKLRESGIVMTEAAFSYKKNGTLSFTEEELKKLSELLGAEFTV